ncbi:MAG: hypothetical protein ABIP75_12145 [Pyrinomonadaceae bacterium]
MVAFFVTSIFLLAFFSIFLYRWRRHHQGDGEVRLPPAPDDPALFAPEPKLVEELNQERHQSAVMQRNDAWLERARAGEREVLLVIPKPAGIPIYDQVLSELVEGADDAGPEEVEYLAQFVIEHDLRANPPLVYSYLEKWRQSTDHFGVTTLLHLAARSNDADVFLKISETIEQVKAEGGLAYRSLVDLLALTESEFWLLDETARNSGAGFLLKQKLANAHRELAAVARDGKNSLPN